MQMILSSNNGARPANAAATSEQQWSQMRREPRISVSIRVLCHAHGSFNTVQIFNMSAGGAALKGCKSLMQGDLIELEFLDCRKISGKVRWWLNGACGIQFSTRLATDDPLLTGKRTAR